MLRNLSVVELGFEPRQCDSTVYSLNHCAHCFPLASEETRVSRVFLSAQEKGDPVSRLGSIREARKPAW